MHTSNEFCTDLNLNTFRSLCMTLRSLARSLLRQILRVGRNATEIDTMQMTNTECTQYGQQQPIRIAFKLV